MSQLTFQKQTREVRYEEDVKVAYVELRWEELRQIILDHVRVIYNLERDDEVDIVMHNYDATVTVTKVDLDASPLDP